MALETHQLRRAVNRTRSGHGWRSAAELTARESKDRGACPIGTPVEGGRDRTVCGFVRGIQYGTPRSGSSGQAIKKAISWPPEAAPRVTRATIPRMSRLVALLLAAVLVVAACGSATTSPTPSSTTPTPAPTAIRRPRRPQPPHPDRPARPPAATPPSTTPSSSRSSRSAASSRASPSPASSSTRPSSGPSSPSSSTRRRHPPTSRRASGCSRRSR